MGNDSIRKYKLPIIVPWTDLQIGKMIDMDIFDKMFVFRISCKHLLEPELESGKMQAYLNR